MFDVLTAMPDDPILSISTAAAADKRADKIDLGVGIYKDEAGHTPVMRAVKAAEFAYAGLETTKKYVSTTGLEAFNTALLTLVLGDIDTSHFATCQGAGGSGALRIGAELIKRASDSAVVYVPTPTWGNHTPLIGSAGIEMKSYPYYDRAELDVNFAAMSEFLSTVPKAGDVIILHGCCHNPTGADLSPDQWDSLADILTANGLIAYVDIAYLGLGDGLDEDCYGVRKLAETQDEMLIAASCSKNFGLYRDRVGLIAVKTKSKAQADIAKSHMGRVMRRMISMPPNHGAAVVAHILGDDELRAEWLKELNEMRERMNGLRRSLAYALDVQGHEDMGAALARQKGMFSMLPVTPEQAARLRKDHSVYLLDSGRINIAGAAQDDIERLASAILDIF
ncbi:amino acid aminotransferase [Robiginitomaculum antarcticum]|uniref:amino acid aminotransferase n=1 Tax=Robiginitomaculum antarcticum TaxID=437507 RepID=UPI00035DEBBF|nr:amino acid aminotransferase [Robiginitomaculum antarcticum]